jgi:integrase
LPKKVLTAASVARLKPPASGQLDIYDKGYPGLFLRLSYGGTRTFSMAYRFGDKQRRVTLGVWPAMQLAEARETWRVIREHVARDVDPMVASGPSKDDFGTVAAEWLKRDQSQNRSHDAVKRLLSADVLPHWQNRRITEITRRDALELVDGVVDRGSPVMARRLHSHLHRLFAWAVGRGVIPANPMAGLPKPGIESRRDRVLSDAELTRVWHVARDWPFGHIYRLLILTGARLREIGELRWDEFHGDLIKLEGVRTKGGVAHTIPLSSPALAVIESVPYRIADSKFVFTSTGRTPVSGWSKAKRLLEVKVGDIGPWHVHDLRRTVATGMQKLGIEERVIEACLGHSTTSRNGLLRVYQVHGFDREKREALDAWGEHVTGLVATEPRRRRAEW